VPGRAKTKVITQVLERIAQDRFEFRDEGEGELIVVRNYGPTFEEMEDFLAAPLADLESFLDDIEENTPDDPRACGPLAENWSDWWTEQLVAELFGREEARAYATYLQGKGYCEVVSILYRLLTQAAKSLAGDVLMSREALTTKDKERLESWLLGLPATSAEDMIASEYARQLAGRSTLRTRCAKRRGRQSTRKCPSRKSAGRCSRRRVACLGSCIQIPAQPTCCLRGR